MIFYFPYDSNFFFTCDLLFELITMNICNCKNARRSTASCLSYVRRKYTYILEYFIHFNIIFKFLYKEQSYTNSLNQLSLSIKGFQLAELSQATSLLTFLKIIVSNEKRNLTLSSPPIISALRVFINHDLNLSV